MNRAQSFFRILGMAGLMVSLASGAWGQTPFSPAAVEQVQGIGPTFAPGVIPAQLPWLKFRHTEVVGIRLLSARPSSLGGVQPFRVRDVRNDIDPQSRLARLTRAGAAPAPGSSSAAIVNCPDGTRYPGAGSFAPNIAFFVPAAGGTCSLSAPSGSADTVFQISSFTGTSATITGQNGWTVNTGTLTSNFAGGSPNPIQVSRAGTTYMLTVTLRSGITAGGGNAVISSFSGT